MHAAFAFRMFAIGMAAAFLGGFIAVQLAMLFTEGFWIMLEEPFAIFGAIFIGLFGSILTVVVATLPAALFGGLLWGLRIHHRGIWAGAGAATGTGCYLVVLAGLFPSLAEYGEIFSTPQAASMIPAFAIGGAVAALFFRYLAELFAPHDQETVGAVA